MAAKVASMSQYEKMREDKILENKRKLEELGVLDAAGDLQRSRPMYSPPVRKSNQSRTRSPAEPVEIRKSARMANRPVPSYREMDVTLEEMESRERKRQASRSGRRSSFVSYMRRGITLETAQQSEEHTRRLGAFVKPMLHSHISSGFWLGLPANFCNDHMPDSIEIFLLSVAGKDCIYETKYNVPGHVWESKYLPHKSGLSGGWRGFSLDLELAEGDCLLFELVEDRHFSVHIFRKKDFGGSPSKAEDAAYAMLDNVEHDDCSPPPLVEARAASPPGAGMEVCADDEPALAQTFVRAISQDNVIEPEKRSNENQEEEGEDEEEAEGGDYKMPAPKLVKRGTDGEEFDRVDARAPGLKLVRLKDVYKVKKPRLPADADEKKA